jgi:hypothetical protein
MGIASHLGILYRTVDRWIATLATRVETLETCANEIPEIHEMDNGVDLARILAIEPLWNINDHTPIILLLPRLFLLMASLTRGLLQIDIRQSHILRQLRICPLGPHLMTPPTGPE